MAGWFRVYRPFGAGVLIPIDAALPGSRLLSGLFRRRVGNGEGAAFVAFVFLICIVEGLEKSLLLMRVVLVGLGLGQVRYVVVGHVTSCEGAARSRFCEGLNI